MVTSTRYINVLIKHDYFHFQATNTIRQQTSPSATQYEVSEAGRTFIEDSRKNMKVMEEKVKVTHNLFSVLFKVRLEDILGWVIYDYLSI